MRRRRRLVLWIMLVVIAALVAVAARPAVHLIKTAYRDRPTMVPPPAGTVDDASRLNQTDVAQIVTLADVAGDTFAAQRELAALIVKARREGLRISIAGARHTMGGHTIYPGGIALDMRGFNAMQLDDSGILRVGAGAMWSEVIEYLDPRGFSVAIMQSNNAFTVGGSVSANCHGWQHNRPPIASTVEAFLLLKADGTTVRCSREKNAELFSLALGGYGLFGVILEVELRVVPNERYRVDRHVMPADAFPAQFASIAVGAADAAMAFGRLSVAADAFLEHAITSVFVRDPAGDGALPPLHEPGLRSLTRTVFRGSVGSEYGKKLRWELEKTFGQHLAGRHFSRNQLLNEPVDYLSRSDATTDIVHEYFVPPEQFTSFLEQLRRIIPEHGGDLLNATVRHVLADDDTFLRYADRELLAIVMLFSQERTPEGEVAMEAMTRDLIDASLACEGRYYLPYRLHAMPEQFHAAYPQARAFFELKRKHDPDEIFQNRFYTTYGR